MVKIPKADRRPKKLGAAFYQTASGSEPVREWLLQLRDEDRKILGEDIATLEFGWPIGMPVCRALGRRLYEVRTDLKDRIARVMFLIDGGEMVLLHGFIKKSQATAKSDLELARKRQRAWEKER